MPAGVRARGRRAANHPYPSRSAKGPAYDLGMTTARMLAIDRPIYSLLSEYQHLRATVANGYVMSESERRDFEIGEAMVNLWPALVDILQDCTDGQLERLGNTSALIQQGVRDARTNNTAMIKRNLPAWLTQAPYQEFWTPGAPALDGTKVIPYGYDYPVTAQLMLPPILSYTGSVPEELRRGRRIFDGVVVNSVTFGRSLWALGLFSAAAPRAHFLEGLLLFYIARAIMHGPQAALGIRSTAVRSSNARTHAITRVTKAFIAYVATQLQFALSNSSDWGVTTDDVDPLKFYKAMRTYLNNPLWQHEIHAICTTWDRQIFPAGYVLPADNPENAMLAMMQAAPVNGPNV